MNRTRTQQGFVLLPVVLLASLVAAAAFLLNHESALEGSVTAGMAETTQARYVAEAGLQHTLSQITQAGCGPYTDITSQPFGNHSYSSTITTNSIGGTITAYAVAVSDDAWISEDQPANNYGSNAKLEVYNKWFASEEHRALYRFDIAASGIPAGAMVVSAVMKIFVVTPDPSTPVSVHPITADWTEDTVTWDNIAGDHDWSSVASIATNPPAGQYVDINITSLVQGWLSGSIANQGIMLKPSGFSNDSLSEYSSKEYATASQRPYLEIKVADGSLANRAVVNVVSTLDSGASRSLIYEDIPLYQPSSTVVLQPDATQGKDTWLYKWKNSWNYGADNEVWVDSRFADSIARSLFEFELTGIPAGVKILSASLALHQNNPSLNGGTMGVHRITAPWVEGTSTGGTGTSSWDEKDSGVSWTTAGGDYDATVISNTTVTASTVDWFEWEVASLVQGWIDGSYENNGLALVPEVVNTAAQFDSSDHTDPTLRPRLTITYACECGVTCQVPQGTGNVLLVVGDDVTLDPADVKKQALFESWGYSVSLIDDEGSQTGFDNALDDNDVAYISETVWGPTLADKLASTIKGVVFEEEDQNSRLGLSSSGSNTVSDSMEVIDNSHYITALFPNAVLPIFNAPMEGMLVTGTPAPGLQTLGNLSGTASLALVDTGGALEGGGTAPGRRVAIPVGSYDKFNWDYLNNNGRLIVQRAIQWGTGNAGGTLTEGYFDEFNSLSCNAALDYIGSDGALDWSSTQWQEQDNGDPCSGNVWLLADQGSNRLGIKGSGGWIDRPVDLSVFSGTTLSFDYLQIGNFSGSNYLLVGVSGDNGSTWTELGRIDAPGDGATYLSASYDIPAASANADSVIRLVAEGLLASREIYIDNVLISETPPDPDLIAHWKLDDGAGPTAIDSVGGHDGTLNNDPTWATGQLDGALDFDGNNDYINAGAILDAGAPQITVTAWVFKRDTGDDRVISKSAGTTRPEHIFSLGVANTTIRVRLRTTDNGGTSDYDGGTISLNQWVHVAFTYDGGMLRIYMNGSETASYAVTGDMIASTLDVAIGNVNAIDDRYWNGLLDDVRIYDRGLGEKEIADLAASGGGGGGASKDLEPLPPDVTDGSSCNGTFRDEFNEPVFSGNSGTLDWAGDWQEINESDGPTSGDVQVFADKFEVPEMPTFQLYVRDNDGGGEGVMRALNLSGAITATLSFDYKPFGLDNSRDYASVQMSTMGTSGPWTEVVRFEGPASAEAYQGFSMDISQYIAAEAVLRVITSKDMGQTDYLWFDNIQITCSSAITF